jgi:predicted dinucleotide-binding enzyme
MKIGIIGSGVVGRTLGNAFLHEGYEVMLGTRNVAKEKVVKWQKANATGQIGDFEQTAAFGELLVLAVRGDAAEEAIELAGIANIANKMVIDTTNPLEKLNPPQNGVLTFFTAQNESLMERLQLLAPKAKFVKAFSSTGSATMYKPKFQEKPTMFICGNDADAKQTVTEILTKFGWDTADMGNIRAASAIEALCILWCIPGFLHNSWGHAFRLLK